MQPSGFQISKGIGNPGGKILKIVQVGNSGSNYVIPGYNAYPLRSVGTSNVSNLSSDVLGSLLAQNQFNISANHVATPTLLSNNMSDNIHLSQSMNSNMGGGNQVSNNQHSSRKPCNCTKSHCLKLYCECFANGQLCDMCNCTNCMNNLNYEDERARAIKMTLDRNPTAFHPKIGRGEGERKHTKGCNCKRSGCLKNYCECYEAKISCTDSCRCQGCKNTEDSIERRSLKRLTALSSLKSSQPDAITKALVRPPSERLPHSFFTWDVIEGITNCLVARAEEIESGELNSDQQERKLIEIYGDCLKKVIDISRSALHTSLSTFSNIMPDNHIVGANVTDVLKSLNNEPGRRDTILLPRTDIDDEDEELDVDLEDTIVMNEDDEDSEVMYNRKSTGRKKVRNEHGDSVWRPTRTPRNSRQTGFMNSPNIKARHRKSFDDDEMLNV